MNLFWYIRWRLDMLRHWPQIQALLPKGGRAVEVGTWRGASAARWLRQEPMWLGLVDPYRVKMDASWEGSVSQAYLERVRRQAMRRVVEANRGSLVSWLRFDSTVASYHVPDASLDLVYVDGDHSHDAVLADLQAWWPKLRPGGFLVLDDHIGGRWWGLDVIVAASGFHPRDERRRWEAGRWLVIQKDPEAVVPVLVEPLLGVV